MEHKVWTVEALKEHFDMRFSAAEKAVEKASQEAKDWKEQSNEWRAAMTDKDNRFALKTDTERINEDVKKLQLSEATLAGKASIGTVYFGYFLAIVAIIISAISLLK